ncbi:putative transcription regulator mTERF family [Arabidopsis thaliana]
MFSLILHGGRRSRELHQWRNLNLLLQNSSAFTESFSSVVTTTKDLSLEDERKRKTFTVSYLIDSLGLTTKLAESISMKANFDEKGNPDSVLKLLRSYGFKDSQISSIISTYPRFLIENPEKTLQIVSKVPKILGKRGGKWISHYYDYVKEILQDQDSSSSSSKRKQTNRNRNVSV